MKACFRCAEQKPDEEFANDRTQKGGLQSWCRSCHQEYGKVKRAQAVAKNIGYDKRDAPWGRSKEWWDERKARCDGKCQVCGELATERDHNHDTELGRGWLCKPCNLAEGLMRSNPTFMENLAKYVRSDGDFLSGVRTRESEVRTPKLFDLLTD